VCYALCAVAARGVVCDLTDCSAPGQACYHHRRQLALLWRAHDHILMHVACSARGYQLRLQSWELGLRPRYVSAASRPSPLLQRQMPCFFVFTDRDEAYPLRAHAVTPPSVAALPIPKHEACTSRLKSSSFRPPGAKSRSGWPVAVSQTTASVASGSSASSVSERRYMASTHMIPRLAAGCSWPTSRSGRGGGGGGGGH
jgi:hypothetical protein